ncbi:MAG TPA: response regulator [Gemmatimonadaceae bacterium]|nr:response regulator [Gemmatimonadaceae bacterium]
MSDDIILVIDDEPQIRRVVRHAIEADIGKVIEASTGRAGIDMAAAERPALIILDLGLPDIDGAEVCRAIRGWSAAPIVVLSARGSVQEKAALLDAGADDYIAKPFSTIELQARVRAQLRRARLAPAAAPTPVLDADGAVIDLARPSVKRDGIAVHLTKTEWQLLRTLIQNTGRTMTHRQLFHAVWGNAHGDMQQYLRVHVRSIRRKIERDPVRPRLIITEPGVGYRFEIEP